MFLIFNALGFCLIFLHGVLFGAIIEPKALSPSSNVHIDVANHVAASLTSHSQQFQGTWRDYSIVFLLIMVIGGVLFVCYGVTVVCIYRRLLIRLVRHAPPMRSDRPPANTSAYTVPA